MTFATWNLLFTGMVSSILLLNVVQWGIYRERIYGLYTLYMLAWLVYFSLRVDEINKYVSANLWYFVRASAPMLAYFVYFDFADALIQLQARLPGLFRLFRLAKAVIVSYLVLMGVLCFGITDWYGALYDTAHTIMRLLMVGLATYGIVQIRQLRGVVPRYIALGSSYLLAGGVVSMIMTMVHRSLGEPLLVMFAPLTYLEFGILAELICFTLVLGYRQRRGAIKSAIVEQRLARERERHQREQVEAELVTEKLQQQMSAMQMMALQTQLNPHFLFNSLNSLSSLIADEPVKAIRFVDEMSSVYRYLLRTNNLALTTLQTELTFIDSYYHLLKTRYGAGIELIKTVDESSLTCKLPPLTLQLLLENAVKHNIVSAENPLVIRFDTSPDGWLTVSNTLQRKTVNRANSTQKGLLNILSKYQLLGQPTPKVEETADAFIVSLPLIED
ncbi:sensor protein lytS [Spirosoma sp. KCTC 42546]|uniref:sensor histidine kinase n=1 Tax=Spirosoma sp. KCTC 42546 TaxID=2520506 RepID=UPI0011599AC4|nr:sensor histidine kinase [Spirosoma sp. KCTC 42546]QDK80297.1 sensor protein lytS [Spirosoma sp. KCTC 42546]